MPLAQGATPTSRSHCQLLLLLLLLPLVLVAKPGHYILGSHLSAILQLTNLVSNLIVRGSLLCTLCELIHENCNLLSVVRLPALLLCRLLPL